MASTTAAIVGARGAKPQDVEGKRLYVVIGAGLAAFISGMSLLVTGAESAALAGELAPRDDFHDIGVVCHVVAVRHCWGTGTSAGKSSQQTDACLDEYVYNFTVSSAEAGLEHVYQSRRETVRRSSTDCGRGCWAGSWLDDTSGGPATGSYAPGERHRCWAPTSKTRAELSERYQCGDGPIPAGDACVKLWDPMVEAGARPGTGAVELVIGALLLIGAFALCTRGLGVRCGPVSSGGQSTTTRV